MLLEHAEDLANFIQELQAETDRGLPLVGAALIDEKLHKTLESFFVDSKSSKKLLTDPNAPLGTFSAKIEACYSLALIDQFEYQEIGLIRKIRNEFAHARHGLSFESEKIKGLCTSLKSPLPDNSKPEQITTRFRLINAIVCIVLRLYYRPEWVKKERREIKKWVPDSRWYNTNDKQPPEGVGFIGLVAKKIDE
ncbi:MltR family transcriptional regulator [uncultured Tolumonas sp.]|uniref:MltR family transcriptional regulator n=1 Tax=uncultured Tolumonas sp. TaxID=263765 RepID=UPI00293194A4|nr:MltR family transcriptional regulator [uncultured Tolumonas sp.]